MKLNFDPTWGLLDAVSRVVWSPALDEAEAQDTEATKIVHSYTSGSTKAFIKRTRKRLRVFFNNSELLRCLKKTDYVNVWVIVMRSPTEYHGFLILPKHLTLHITLFCINLQAKI